MENIKESKMIEREMTSGEIQERKNQIADKTMEISRLDKERIAFAKGRNEVVKHLKKEIETLSDQLALGTIEERNPLWIGKGD